MQLYSEKKMKEDFTECGRGLSGMPDNYFLLLCA